MKKNSKASKSAAPAPDTPMEESPSSQTQETKRLSPFDFITSISFTKDESVFEQDPGSYLPFMVNRGLSYFPDTILYANEMNQRAHIDKYHQFIYLLGVVRPRKRFSKWAKAQKDENLDLVKTVYKMSDTKARAVLALLSTEQIEMLKQRQETGGVTNERGRKSRGGKAS